MIVSQRVVTSPFCFHIFAASFNPYQCSSVSFACFLFNSILLRLIKKKLPFSLIKFKNDVLLLKFFLRSSLQVVQKLTFWEWLIELFKKKTIFFNDPTTITHIFSRWFSRTQFLTTQVAHRLRFRHVTGLFHSLYLLCKFRISGSWNSHVTRTMFYMAVIYGMWYQISKPKLLQPCFRVVKNYVKHGKYRHILEWEDFRDRE